MNLEGSSDRTDHTNAFTLSGLVDAEHGTAAIEDAVKKIGSGLEDTRDPTENPGKGRGKGNGKGTRQGKGRGRGGRNSKDKTSKAKQAAVSAFGANICNQVQADLSAARLAKTKVDKLHRCGELSQALTENLEHLQNGLDKVYNAMRAGTASNINELATVYKDAIEPHMKALRDDLNESHERIAREEKTKFKPWSTPWDAAVKKKLEEPVLEEPASEDQQASGLDGEQPDE